jgi:enolase
MNAILSMSIALGRVTAAKDGRELWQLVREQAAETMAKFIATNSKEAAKKDWQKLYAMNFEELKKEYQATAAVCVKEGKTIYELLRKELPVYQVT